MEETVTTAEFSLLYPAGGGRQPAQMNWNEAAAADLGLEDLAAALSYHPRHRDRIRAILLELSHDTRLIAYRQEILEDFMGCPALVSGLDEILPLLAKLRESAATQSQGTPVRQALGRLTELNTYVSAVRMLSLSLDRAGSSLHSEGLIALREILAGLEGEESFRSLAEHLPELLSELNGIPSVTIGINLDSELLPVQATLLSINEKPFKSCTLLDYLMGKRNSGKPDQGVGPLHKVPKQHVEGIDSRVVPLATYADPLMVPLFRDLHEILRQVLKPITAALKAYAQVNARLLIALEDEISFYLGAAALIAKLRERGLPTCRPGILPRDDRESHVHGLYNLILALDQADDETELTNRMVLNEADFGPQGRIFILTGPNQGGKTVYTQAVGLAQVLFQAGLHIPAQQAQMSPVDGIFTHFATMEKAGDGMGRLGEESRRLNEIFRSVTRFGLVLLNESLSSTSPGESLYLARDIIRALRLFSVRAIFATHLHELAEGLDAINAEIDGDSLLVSLVAGVVPGGESADGSGEIAARTYRIEPGPPRGLSYAKGIAARYGISYEQLAGQWQERIAQVRPSG